MAEQHLRHLRIVVDGRHVQRRAPILPSHTRNISYGNGGIHIGPVLQQDVRRAGVPKERRAMKRRPLLLHSHAQLSQRNLVEGIWVRLGGQQLGRLGRLAVQRGRVQRCIARHR